MEISIVTDEISSDFETALEIAASWDIHAVEIRGYGENRVPLFSPYQQLHIREALSIFPMKISAVSPGLFKMACPMDHGSSFPVSCIDCDSFQKRMTEKDCISYQLNEVLPKTFAFAKEMHCPFVGIFSFMRTPGQAEPPDEVLKTLLSAAEAAKKEHITLVIETEAGHWADTGAHAASILKAVDHPALALNWDPGNSAEAGDIPFPDGYAYVKGMVRHVHFKDVMIDEKHHFHYVTSGAIQWKEQIKALEQDGYSGCISIETHMRPKVSSATASLKRLRELLKGS